MIALSVPSMLALAAGAPPLPPEAEPAACGLPAIATEQSGIRLDLNIPAFRLDVYAAERRSITFTVAVGDADIPHADRQIQCHHGDVESMVVPPPSEWARDEKPIPPGPHNPMGRVKLQFGPLAFLHGTPDEASLGTAASHACVRMADRGRVPDAVLGALARAGYAADMIDAEVLADLIARIRLDSVSLALASLVRGDVR